VKSCRSRVIVGARLSVLSVTTDAAPVRLRDITPPVPSASTVIPSRVSTCVASVKSRLAVCPSTRLTLSRACGA
jgi:hypothetical protein